MLNNSGTYGPNEAPPNIVTSISRPQSDTSNMSHNFNDFGKFPQQAASSATGFYEAHNFHNFGRSPVTIPPIMHPFQAYQSFGHEPSYFSQNAQISYENAVQNYFPAVNTNLQAENHNKMLNFDPNFHTKHISQSHTSMEKGSISKGYPLNIPQVPSRLFHKSPKIEKNTQDVLKFPENNLTLSQSASQVSTTITNTSNIENTELKSDIKLSSSSVIPLQSPPEGPPINTDHQNNIKIPENTKHELPENSSETPIIKKTTYNIIKTNTAQKSIFEKCFNENKRKSVEKTVRLIESILISSNNTTRSDIIENTDDPLALSPNPAVIVTNTINKTGKNSDEEVSKNALSKRKKKLTKRSSKIVIQAVEPSKEVANRINVKIEDVKLEPCNWPDLEFGNPFHRDSNGTVPSDIGGNQIIDMGSSEQEAIDIIRNGSTTDAYFECPHCSLMLRHPKRFLIHTKWHSFGLLNEKRAEILKQREDRTRAKRQARSMQRLTDTITSGIDGVTRFSCKDCDGVFPTKTSLKNHRRKAHSAEVTECRICLAPVRGASELRAHLASHEAAGLHQCPRCPKRFKYRHSLAKHADTHREKTHSCTECGKLFGSSALVRLHMKVHERAARGTSHRCAYCGKGFYEAYNLHVHERTHRNDKPFICDICDSRFVTNSSLKRHLKVSHSGAKPFPCQVCQKCFSSATIRDRHELRAHSDLDHFPHQCKLCPRRYMKAKDLRSHTYKMHPKEKKKNEPSDVEQNSS